MAGIPAIVGAALIAAGTTAATTLLTPRAKAQAPVRQPTRNEARERADRNDLLARRRGTGANRRVGYGQGEASTGAKKSLLGR